MRHRFSPAHLRRAPRRPARAPTPAQEPVQEPHDVRSREHTDRCAFACCVAILSGFLLRTHVFSLASVPIPSRLLRSSDAGDEAKRHHRHLVAVMDVADAENSVDRMFAGLGRPKRDGEDKYALFNACPHHLLFEGDAKCKRATIGVPLATDVGRFLDWRSRLLLIGLARWPRAA